MFRDMTDAEQLAWGRAEREARTADLRLRGAEGLRRAQTNAEARRKVIGATRSQAARLVARANNEKLSNQP